MVEGLNGLDGLININGDNVQTLELILLMTLLTLLPWTALAAEMPQYTALPKISAPIYADMDKQSKQVGRVNPGFAVDVYAIYPEWLYVGVGKARGYVLASALSTTKPSNWTPAKGSTSQTTLSALPSGLIASSSSSNAIEKVIAVAQKKMGAPYVHGAKGPDSFDCAGFTYYCYKKGAGITLKGSSQGQGYDDKYTKITDIDDLERGDLVCFDTDESDDDLSDHVGIYMGDGWFIHASSAAGQVIISRLDTGYYERVFSWGRRIIE